MLTIRKIEVKVLFFYNILEQDSNDSMTNYSSEISIDEADMTRIEAKHDSNADGDDDDGSKLNDASQLSLDLRVC